MKPITRRGLFGMAAGVLVAQKAVATTPLEDVRAALKPIAYAGMPSKCRIEVSKEIIGWTVPELRVEDRSGAEIGILVADARKPYFVDRRPDSVVDITTHSDTEPTYLDPPINLLPTPIASYTAIDGRIALLDKDGKFIGLIGREARPIWRSQPYAQWPSDAFER